MQSSRHSPSAGFEISVRESPIRVVVAEDDQEFRGMLSSRLRRDGYEVIEAQDGLGLLELVQSTVLRSDGDAAVELVIADVRMPGATGLLALAELRSHDWNIPVILISAFADPETRAEAARLGAMVMDKPFDLQELVWFVRQNT